MKRFFLNTILRNNGFEKRLSAIAGKLKMLRMAAGYKSFEKFAYENGLPRVQYWRMEKGTNFRLKTLLRVLDVHKMSLRTFFADIE